VVLLRVLIDNNDLHTPTGHIAVGWLVVEDLFTVLVLVLLPAVFQAEFTSATGVVLVLAWSTLKLILLVAFVIYAGGRLIPWLLGRVAATRSRELFTLTVLVLALGIAVGAATLFGVSMALGAFLAGMVVGRTDFSSRAASEALPMRDAFAVLFFVSVGMLFDPAQLVESPGLVVATLAIILLGKPCAAFAIVLLLRYPVRVALSVAVALAQIGEFSFILAAQGRELGILHASAVNTLIAAALVSISLNPVLYPLIDVLEKHAKSAPRLWYILNARARLGLPSAGKPSLADTDAPRHRAVVVGYGPVGRTLVRLLQENGIEPTVIELNLDTVHRLRAEGLSAIYGDAIHKETVLEAGGPGAAVFILSASGTQGKEEAIRQAREVNPAIRVFARADYLRQVPALRRAGADAVFAGEGEVALTMTEFIMRQLGASPEQIDRERERIRAELFGTPLTIEILLPPPTAPTKDEPAPASHGAAPAGTDSDGSSVGQTGK